MYQVWSQIFEEWTDSPPIYELRTLLDKHPDGVSFVASESGRTVYWRKRPRDEELIAAIGDAIVGEGSHPQGTAASRVYDLLRERGVSV